MKIVIISGSSRKKSQSLKVARYLSKQLVDMGIDAEIIDLHSDKISIVPDDVWADDSEQVKLVANIKQKLEQADGYVVVTPEWNGMAAPALKNLFIHVGFSMQHKPALIVAVSATRGGAYPVAELRMSSYKNPRINYIPENLIIRDVEGVLNDQPDESNPSDAFYRKQSKYALSVLIEYAKALQAVRASGVIDHDTFPVGM